MIHINQSLLYQTMVELWQMKRPVMRHRCLAISEKRKRAYKVHKRKMEVAKMSHSCWEFTVEAENNQGQYIQSATIYNWRDIGWRNLTLAGIYNVFERVKKNHQIPTTSNSYSKLFSVSIFLGQHCSEFIGVLPTRFQRVESMIVVFTKFLH